MVMTVAPEIEARIREKVESGQYESTDALMGTALRLLDLHEKEQEKLERLRALIAEGEEGPFVPLTPEVRAASWERAKQRAKAGERPDANVMPSDDTL
jgi:putative addiction module CopG family antidote